MNKINLFFQTLYKSFTSPAYYADVVKAPFSFSLKYYSVFQLLFAIVAAVYITTRWVVPFSEFLETLPAHVMDIYPDELVVTINNGQVSTNVDEPYAIPVSALKPIEEEFDNKVLGAQESDIENLLVIDTQGSIDNFHSYQTYTLLTWDSFSYINDDGNVETTPLSEVENMTIDRQQVQSFVDTASSFFAYVIPVAAGGIVIGFMLLASLRLLYLLVITVLFFLIALIMKANISFLKLYQINLHITLIPLVVFSLLTVFEVPIGFPFLGIILHLVLGAVILFTIKNNLKDKIEKPTEVVQKQDL